jgi:hypothetical protein
MQRSEVLFKTERYSFELTRVNKLSNQGIDKIVKNFSVCVQKIVFKIQVCELVPEFHQWRKFLNQDENHNLKNSDSQKEQKFLKTLEGVKRF